MDNRTIELVPHVWHVKLVEDHTSESPQVVEAVEDFELGTMSTLYLQVNEGKDSTVRPDC
jgi:hypothetical protein